MVKETILLEGHILDSHTLSKVFDFILSRGACYEILDLSVGCRPEDPSRAKLFVAADSEAELRDVVEYVALHGGVRAERRDVRLAPAPAAGVFPEDFYSTTNLETVIRLDGVEIPVAGEAMDVGIMVDPARMEAREVPMDEVRCGDLFVVGTEGISITPVKRERGRPGGFGFMQSEVSVEKPRRRVLEEIAASLTAPRRPGGRNLLVLGPAAVHSGAVKDVETILSRGLFQVLFGGNAVAAHDIELALFGTSLGIDLRTGVQVPSGHQNHLRAINTIRRAGGIGRAVEGGILSSGIMHAAYRSGVDVFLAGSIRDDGPLPEVRTDVLEAKREMRKKLEGVDVAVMVATALHSVAAGNLLPARVRTFCVDINPSSVTKLLDRGSAQAVPIVMDCESFFHELVELTA